MPCLVLIYFSQGHGPYWRDAGPDSAITKMERHYWITKQNVFKKMGKKEDECIVASDAELDAKLVLFKSIEDNCLDLQKIIDKYQDRICCKYTFYPSCFAENASCNDFGTCF